MRNSGGRTLLYTPDAQGNVSQQVNASTGAVVASYAYDAWGGRTVATSDPTAASDPFAGYGELHGYYTDWETGLQLAGLRYYDSAAGRWLNRDPISYAGGVNVYEYCGNGPVGMSDASGLWSKAGAIGGAIACLAALVNFVSSLRDSPCVPNSICHLVVDCVIGGGCLAFVADAVVVETGCLGAFWANCIAAAVCSAFTSLCDEMCDVIKPCPGGNLLNDSICSAMDAAASCISGGALGWMLRNIKFFRPKDLGYIIGNLLGDGFGDFCSQYPPIQSH